MFKPTVIAVSIALALCSFQARAESLGSDVADLAALPLDKLLDMEVSGASKFSTTVAQTAAAVTVITREEIQAQGYRTVAEALSSVKGVITTSDWTYGYIGVRGFYVPGDYNTRILMLVNGNRVNDALFDQAYIGNEFPVDMDDIERVEFIPGQGSAVYGANALFAVVNVVTRDPHKVTAFETSASAGSFGTYRARVSNTFRFGGEGIARWSVSDTISAGQDVESKGAVVHGGDRLRRTSVSLDARWGDWTLSAVHGVRKKGMPVMLSGVPGDNSALSVDDSALYNLTWAHDTDAGDQALVRLFAGDYKYRGSYAFESAPDVTNKDLSTTRWWGAEARLTTSRFKNHTITVGTELQFVPSLVQYNADVTSPQTVYLDRRATSHRAAIFAEDLMQLAKDWTVATNIRLDSTKGYPRQFTGRTAFIWRPQDTVVAKLIYGTAYRSPNDFEADYAIAGPSGFVVNPNLQAEHVRGLEFNLEWSPSTQDRISVSAYQNTARALIAQMYNETMTVYQFVNQGAVVAKGLEAEWQHSWASGARLRANISHTSAADRNDLVAVAAYAPRYIANAVLSTPLPAGLTAGVWWHAEAARGAAGPYSLLGLNLSSEKRLHAWNWSLHVSNLFNRSYATPGTDLEAQPRIPQGRRSIDLRVERDF